MCSKRVLSFYLQKVNKNASTGLLESMIIFSVRNLEPSYRVIIHTKVCYLNMHYSVFRYILQKQKYLEKIGTNIAVRSLCIVTIFSLSSQRIVLVLRALCLPIFVELCLIL